MGQQANYVDWPIIVGIILSVLILLWGTITFIRDRFRKTKFIVVKPIHYDIIESILQIDFAFFSDGPKPIIVRSFRLLPSKGLSFLKFSYTIDKFGWGTRKNNIPFIVKAGEPYTIICGFNGPVEELLKDKSNKLELQAKLGNSEKWVRKICQFSLNDCMKVEHPESTVIPDPFE